MKNICNFISKHYRMFKLHQLPFTDSVWNGMDRSHLQWLLWMSVSVRKWWLWKIKKGSFLKDAKAGPVLNRFHYWKSTTVWWKRGIKHPCLLQIYLTLPFKKHLTIVRVITLVMSSSYSLLPPCNAYGTVQE